MQPTEARDVGDALDDRPVPAVWPRPTHVGNEKYLADFWIIEAIGRSRCGATLRKPPAAPTADAGVQRWLRRVGSFSTGVPESLERRPGAVSDRGRGVRSRVSGRPRGAPRTTGDDPRCSTW